MMGRIKFNLFFGIVAFIITFITALSENVMLVSLVRAVFAFFLFFMVAFPVRWIFSLIIGRGQAVAETEKEAGIHVNLVTPDNAEQSESESDQETFTPLVIPRLDRLQTESDPANIANIVRRFTDE